MPPAAVTCPGCQTRLKVTEQMLGKSIQCPTCKKVLKLAGAQQKTQPEKKSAPLPNLELDETPPPSKKPAEKRKEKPVEEVLDESSLETVEDVDQVEEVEDVEEVDETPKPARARTKRPAQDDEDDESDTGTDRPLNTEEHGDPLVGLGLNKKQIKEVKEELLKGERVIWAGTTSDRVHAYNAQLARIFGIIFLAVGSVIFAAAVLGYLTGVMPFVVFIAMFVFVLIWCALAALAIFVPVLYRRAKKRRADGEKPHLSDLFILTNRRCLCWMSRFSGQRFSYNALQVREMQRKDHTSVKGAGDLVFDETEELHTTSGRHASAHVEVIPLGFIGIDNVRAVERLVRMTLLHERD